MKVELQRLKIPSGCKINKNEFFTYDPATEYSEEKSDLYLLEDLLQIVFKYSNLVIDLGWYGDASNNDGEFIIKVVENKNWEKPLRTKSSKSQKTITAELEKILMEIKDTGKIKACA
ncbi:hypothetical protein [Flavobacterium ardleyense]|uniref:hypothetical protein n=1 Tax=Flavobacterium ardleyense TaxID=2038737 RepID=UPI00298BD8E2|nr:hypothetical protein [Flavobacterium ardleyense]